MIASHLIFKEPQSHLIPIHHQTSELAGEAVIGKLRTLASEISGENVRLNAVAPGWIDSTMKRPALAGIPHAKRGV
ncbi:MAG: hypothetical protein RLZZ522_1144 [Verrucomicrobiota bacterium]|jgi:enoyl-[acyl-carrier-protein] reductase (NADH)